MRMLINSPLNHQLLDKIVRWLVNFVPHEISDLQVTELIHRAVAAKHFVLEELSEQRSVAKLDKLLYSSESEVKSAWANFNWGLRDSLKWLASLGSPREDVNVSSILSEQFSAEMPEEAQITKFLQHFDANVSLLERVIERNVLAVPELLDEIRLTAACNAKEPQPCKIAPNAPREFAVQRSIAQPTLQKSKLRRIPSQFKASSSGIFGLWAAPKFGRVLVEYSSYGKAEDETRRKNDARMEHLVNILSESNSGFNTLSCLGWTAVPQKFRYALIFRNPYNDPCQPLTLYDIMRLPGKYFVVYIGVIF